MPALTRRLEKNRQQTCWQVFYGDVQVGVIGERAGVPTESDQWGWDCGFFPAVDRGLRAGDTAISFEKARDAFAKAWARYLPRCTEEDFDGYRRQRAWTAWKYRMQESGCKLPTQMPELRSRCYCGQDIYSATMDRHIFTAHMPA